MSLKARVTIQPLQDDHFEHLFEFKFPKKFSAWKIYNKQYKFSFQEQLIDINCSIHDDLDDVLYCSHSAAKKLLLPLAPTPLSIVYNQKEESMHIKPIIAVVTNVQQQGVSVKIGSITKFCEELAQFCKQNGLFFYIFSPGDMQDHFVHGYIYLNNMWQKQKLPLPDVIYNRIHSRSHEKNLHTFFTKCKDLEIPIFNERYLNKWEVHETLSTYDHLVPYLPETIIHRRKSSLFKFVEKYESIFLKPIYGSQGKHIYRINRVHNQYHLMLSSHASQNVIVFSTFDDLFETLSGRIGQKPYIVQQGLSLLKHHDRTVDFRILCHRDYIGDWKATSIVARISPKKNFVANVAQGGELTHPEKVLNTNDDTKQIVKALKELALEICNITSNEFEGFFGEFGVDLVLDEFGKIWFIEVNTKPSKNLDGALEQKSVRPSAKAILQHCCFLAKF
jgi:glutathione synthase/RimK-type ligase-like ATP-grasp enzyme